jgi:hypothetical protein
MQRGCLSTTIPELGRAEAIATEAAHAATIAKIQETKGVSIGQVLRFWVAG